MPIALFILGHAGSGKTKLSKKWIKSRLKKGEPWALLDKDICGELLSNALMESLGMDPNDRDSEAFKLHVRDLEYKNCLKLAKVQLKLGINVVLPGPWNKELASEALFDSKVLDFSDDVRVAHVYLDASKERIKKRVLERMNARDQWKRNNWEEFEKTLVRPDVIDKRGIMIVNDEDDDQVLNKIKAIIS
jgi:predicted kinase